MSYAWVATGFLRAALVGFEARPRAHAKLGSLMRVSKSRASAKRKSFHMYIRVELTLTIRPV